MISIQEYTSENRVWERPVLVPIPENDIGILNQYIPLNGYWKFTDNPPPEYWRNDVDPKAWDEVPVPAELFALGYDIRRNREYVYKKRVIVPNGLNSGKIILKTGMAFEYSKVWINGNFVRDHCGGFTTFDCDITGFITPGEPFWVTVMCMQRKDALLDFVGSEGSQGYAGLIDDIGLLNVPVSHITRLHYVTDFDVYYKDAKLKVAVAYKLDEEHKASLRIEIFSPEGVKLDIVSDSIALISGSSEINIDIPVESPIKWDAEHPNLYTLKVNLESDGGILQSFIRKIGFRKVERIGNNLYINGVLTKLRGAARYSHDPLVGKTFSNEQLEMEVRLIKQSNINFIRSSAYPEREALYNYCDIYGVYVEECAPANFQRGAWDSQKDMVKRHSSDIPTYKAEYMNQFAEMIERDKSHPSVIIWEYANESDWGVNFQAELDYLKEEDSTRLTAGTWDNTKTSIASYHYPEYNQLFSNAGLYDEFVHLAAHAVNTLYRDPAIRNAWGLSLSKGWETLFPSDGFIGCAIFALGDYIIMRPKGDIFAKEFGSWGLVDSWYREKPELWLTKKAYSPVRIKDKYIKNPGRNKPLQIPVKNWYCNTNFNELTFKWRVNSGYENEMEQLNLAPGSEGIIVIPEKSWNDGDVLDISVLDKFGMLVDKYELTVLSGELKKGFKYPTRPAPFIYDNESEINIWGETFKITFCKKNGLIKNGEFNGETLIESGPYLNLYGMYYKPSDFSKDRKGDFGLKFSGWKKETIYCETEGNDAVIYISGSYPGSSHKDIWGFEFGYETLKVQYIVRIDGNGLISTTYTIENPPQHMFCEVGISYILTNSIDKISWDRDALYSAYPENHIGRPCGTANRYRKEGIEQYRVKPGWNWAYDEYEYLFFGGTDCGGHCTRDFRSTRENIWYTSAISAESNNRVRAEADGSSVSVRVCNSKDEDLELPLGVKFTINNQLYYDLGNGSNPSKTGDGYLGNFTYPEIYLKPGYSNEVKMRLTDNDDYTFITYDSK